MAEGRVLQVLGPSTGGIRRHVDHLRGELVRRGWSVPAAGPAGVLDDLDHVVPIPSGLEPIRAVRARGALRAALGDADLLHAHGLKAGWVAASLRRRPPVVVTLHNVVLPEAAGRTTPLLRALERRLPGRADAVIAVSRGVADHLGEAIAAGPGGPGVHVIPPVGPPARPRREPGAVRADLGAGSRPLVVCVARLHPQKDLGTLLAAAEPLRARVPDVLVAIVGEGPLEATLRREIEVRGLAGTVLLTGPRANAADELAAADVVAVPSRWESGPLVVAEALQLARPVVATPVGFVPDLITDGVSGRLVPIGDPAALAAALVEVLLDPITAARMGATGRDRVGTALDPGRLVSAVEAVYRATLGRP